jgi:hypothetical protein
MEKLFITFLSFLFVIAINVGQANAVPDIRGEYSGTYTSVLSNCTDSEKDGTYNNIPFSIIFSNQTGDSFSGSANGTFNIDGFNETEYIQISGTITETGQINGITSHTFMGTGGEGTFTGQLSGNTLSIENHGQDTYGETCKYVRYMSATLDTCKIFTGDLYAPGDPPYLSGSIMSVSPLTGNSNVISYGGLLESYPQNIEVDEQGDLIVAVNNTSGEVVRVDRLTGTPNTYISRGINRFLYRWTRN